MNKKLLLSFALFLSIAFTFAQNVMTPELLWKLGRVNGETLSPDGKNVIYSVKYYDMAANKGESNLYAVSVNGGAPKQITITAGTEYGVQTTPNGKMGYLYNGQWWESDWDGKNAKQISNVDGGVDNVKFSPDGKHVLYTQDVKTGTDVHDRYTDLPKANVQEADDLLYRHWDTWEDDMFSHVFVADYMPEGFANTKDIMAGESYDCPQKPFGGAEDVAWATNNSIVYVCKKKSGKDYAVSTNTDIYEYSLLAGKTRNLTEKNLGYDTNPQLSPDRTRMAWLSMERDGYEADKNRLMIADSKASEQYDATLGWDETVSSFTWSSDGNKIYFIAPRFGTDQLFSFDINEYHNSDKSKAISQITDGIFDVAGIIGETAGHLIISRTDMNHATEIFNVDLSNGQMKAVTETNKAIYDGIQMSRTDKVWVTTTDKKKELVWVIYPPGFDATKKYPTLLYCQGGPQGMVSQFYSYRWNFQLMAANNYIIVAPCRRGMPGFGTAWNEEISTDWGGQAIQDYLSAIDSISKYPYVDVNRRGAVGASYGGYSVYMLAGLHDGRFKTFIAHCGVFDLKAMYNSTEEIWFTNWDLGGPWWNNPAPGSYKKADPMTYIDKWNTPMLIITGEKDYRIPYTQSLEAYQICQLKGIKSRLEVFPDEGHWVMQPQDGLLWHREFFRWLDETLK